MKNERKIMQNLKYHGKLENYFGKSRKYEKLRSYYIKLKKTQKYLGKLRKLKNILNMFHTFYKILVTKILNFKKIIQFSNDFPKSCLISWKFLNLRICLSNFLRRLTIFHPRNLVLIQFSTSSQTDDRWTNSPQRRFFIGRSHPSSGRFAGRGI